MNPFFSKVAANRAKRFGAAATSVSDLLSADEAISDELESLEKAAQLMGSDSWEWMVKVFLPTILREVEHERSVVEPDDTKLQCVYHGRVLQISELSNRLGEVQQRVRELTQRRLAVRRLLEKRTKQNGR